MPCQILAGTVQSTVSDNPCWDCSVNRPWLTSINCRVSFPLSKSFFLSLICASSPFMNNLLPTVSSLFQFGGSTSVLRVIIRLNHHLVGRLQEQNTLHSQTSPPQEICTFWKHRLVGSGCLWSLSCCLLWQDCHFFPASCSNTLQLVLPQSWF